MKTKENSLLTLAFVLLGIPAMADDLVWAINVGGGAYDSSDGISYSAEEFVTGGEVGSLESVKGSQDPTLYQSYRAGDVVIERPLENGIYDVTFHFAEPDEVPGGAREFDALINNQVVLHSLDVMSYRDGQIRSALTVTAANVNIDNRKLHVAFDATAGEPILSALVVRSKNRPEPNWELVWSDEFDTDGMPNSGELDDKRVAATRRQ